MTFEAVLDSLRREAKGSTHAHTGLWVSAQLRQRIAAGELLPGTKLSEEALGEALGVSRNTLREAFTALHAEHIVTRIPNRGVFVARPTAEDIREIYRIRRFLEPAAVLWHERSPMDDLRNIVAGAEHARAQGDIGGMANANQEFHRALVARAGSERLNSLMEQVLAEMRLVFHSMGSNPAFHEPYVADNAQVIELLASGDNTAASEFMRHYLDRAESQLLEAIAGGPHTNDGPPSLADC
ncbi:GntR family transcriptional regulator [Arthrobacter sp. C9C5]|uniref:GntR family transcriptional regulator n=1 Tax=Arthrobacter sp. C9C5 TaxID=2735267 RepID=UPI001584EC33|nr:GntR family transcriptional regulator [Arthrobacter sp. C9C5]NUU32968.1 GntR family transcriptional regulator [Arthrobacter sp. C9C5]